MMSPWSAPRSGSSAEVLHVGRPPVVAAGAEFHLPRMARSVPGPRRARNARREPRVTLVQATSPREVNLLSVAVRTRSVAAPPHLTLASAAPRPEPIPQRRNGVAHAV